MKMGINELTAKVSELRELYRMADELENMIDTIEKAIREHMTAADLDTIAGPDYKISWKQFNRSGIDTRALKQELPEIAARYTVTRTVRPFVLT
jgi:predicted phage-related endonuclease